MANKPDWVQDPQNPNRMTYTDVDGSVYESVKDAPQEAPQEAAGAQWVQDPNNPARMTYTDSDGSVYESIKDTAEPSQAKATAPANDIPFADSTANTPEQSKAIVDARGNRFSEKIDDQGGWGISDKTRNELGGVTSPLAGAADLAYRGLQGVQALTEVAAEGVDDAFDKSGFSDLPKVFGSDLKLHPGEAAMALMEAFPAGGLEAGMVPRGQVPKAPVMDADTAFALKTKEMIKSGATREDLDNFAVEAGKQPFGPDLEKVLEARDTNRPWDAVAGYRTKSQEKIVKDAVKANPEDPAAALQGGGHSPDLLDKNAFAPMKDRKIAAEQARVDDIQSRIDVLTEDWTNKPEFEVVHKAEDVADPEIRQSAVDSAGEGALGFLGPDGKVRLLADNIKSPDELHAVVFHEALGHYGLAQKFGDDLTATLNNFYENGSGDFRAKVDDWMKENPDYYKGQDNPHLLAAEEVLAEMSERGAIPAELKDRITNQVKDAGRTLGLNLKFSDREINTILGMSHDAVIRGTGRDVIANGFRYARVYHGSKHDFNEFSNNHPETGSGAQMIGHGTYVTEDMEYAKAYRGGKTGKLYEVNVPDRGWLKWDDKLSNQPDVLQAFKDAGFEIHNRNWTAGDAYKDAAFEYGQEAVSKALNEHGITGNAYKDYDGTQNYVVFNPKDAEIVNKYMRRRRVAGDDPDNPTGAMMAGNINLDRISTSRDVSGLLDDLAKNAPLERKTWDQVKSEARDLNINPTKIGKDTKGVGNLSAKLYAYRQVQTDVLDRVAELGEKLSNNYNEADHANYLSKLNQLAVTHARVSNDTTEIARALASLKITAQSSKRSSEILEAFAQSGLPASSLADKDVFMRFMKNVQALQNSGNPQGAAALMNKIVKPYWEDYILSGRHSLMLSGLGTHLKNVRDNLNMIGREYIEAGVTVPFGGVSKEEMMGRTYGLIRAALDSTTYKDTWTAFRDGTQNTMLNTKTELESARIPVLSKVGDALNAEDTFFRRFMETSNLYAVGVREARKQGFSGRQLFAQGSHLAQNPTEEMLKASRNMADVALLVSEPSKLAKAIETSKARKIEMTSGERTARFIAHLAFPFLRTTENLLFAQLRRSPLSFMDRVSREDLLAGGERRATAISRTLMGTTIMGYYIYAAKEGDVTGGEKDYKKVQALEPGGYKPNSVVSKDAYTDATALNTSFPNPFGLDNATAANMATLVNTYDGMIKAGEDKGTAFAATVKAFVKVIGAASFAQNMQPYVEAFSEKKDDTTKSAAAVGGLASQFVPALGRQANNAYLDTQKRDYSGDGSFKDRVVGRIQSGIPGWSDNAPLKYDVYGQTIDKGVNITGIDAKKMKSTDPTVKEMIRVEDTIDKPVITAAPKTITVEGQKAKLTGENYALFQKTVGENLRKTMAEIIREPGYKQLSDKDKREVLREVQTEARKAAKESIIERLKIEDFKDPDEDK